MKFSLLIFWSTKACASIRTLGSLWAPISTKPSIRKILYVCDRQTDEHSILYSLIVNCKRSPNKLTQDNTCLATFGCNVFWNKFWVPKYYFSNWYRSDWDWNSKLVIPNYYRFQLLSRQFIAYSIEYCFLQLFSTWV